MLPFSKSPIPLSFDALIVGAGPAGCAAAFDLAQAGRRVLLLDKRSFPRHKACACGLTRKTLKALRYSVEPVIERQCRDVVLQEAGPAFLAGRRTADKGCEVRVHLRNPFCAMAVRERFDAFCLARTLASGEPGRQPELRKIDSILALRELPTHIELDLAMPGGGVETLRAPVLIGADGSNGQTRRLAAGIESQTRRLAAGLAAAPEVSSTQLPAEPAWYARGFALEATVPYTALPRQLPAGDGPLDLVFDFAPVAGGYGWLFPKGDHINIGIGGFVPQTAAGTAGAGAESMIYETVTRSLLDGYTRSKLGIDLRTLPDAHVTGQHLGLGGHAYTPAGRILLTGDAAGLVDPLTGEGIHSAIVSGQAAAAAVLEAVPADAGRETLRADAGDTPKLAAAYLRYLGPLQATLAFSYRAARSFYRKPERGFKVMRTPLLRNLVLKTYADGLPTTSLLAGLARRVA